MVIGLKNYSIWLDSINKNNYPKLDKNIEVDILIIGGGITGISTAYHLINKGLNVCLVDRNKIGHGISSKTTGKLTILQDLMYTKLSKKHSSSILSQYLNSQKDAIKLVEEIIRENNIDCDFAKQKSYLFASTKEDVTKVKHEEELLKFMKVKTNKETLPINIKNYYAISVDEQAYFHPLKYIYGLAKACSNNDIKIYENTKVTKLAKKDDLFFCYVDKYIIKAKKVVLACHYPFFVIPFLFPLKGHLERSYISASKVNEVKCVSGINTSKSSISFRYQTDNLNNYFLYLNNSHNLAFKFNLKNNFNKLLNNIEALNFKPEYIWSNIDIITNDYLPYIGLIKENLYIGTGYNTWGMTNGSIAGKLLSDLILNKNNKYKKLFDPKRSSSSICSITTDIFSSAKPFIQNKLIKNKPYYAKNVIFTKRNGKSVAIYKDENGIEHIVYNKCPHLKCSLIFNEIEKTWDCPCHASRFTIDGEVIEGPSNYNIKFKD